MDYGRKTIDLAKSQFMFHISKIQFTLDQNHIKTICAKYIVPEIEDLKVLGYQEV